MSLDVPRFIITFGTELFPARLLCGTASASYAYLKAMLPYSGSVIHARWSGEAIWSPLEKVAPPGAILPPENPDWTPEPGMILLYAGASSEPELLIPYGPCRFACKAGPLGGNPLLSIEHGLTRIAELGREILWRGAMPFAMRAHHEG